MVALQLGLFLGAFCYSVQAVLPVVHLIPHSHCDAGYRESFQEYYDLQVHNIIDSMLVALSRSSNRKFVWEETSFLAKWWKNATDDQKHLMRKLIDEERLEMIGGGWVMHDEAVNNAATILNQMALGLKYLNETLSVRPKYEWHIDPFGHSLMMPELYTVLKYDAIVINRIPDHIKQRMRIEQGLEFYWKSSFTNATMFTHVLDMHYATPLILGQTIKEKALSLATTCLNRLKWYKTDQLLIPFGGDFDFQNATDNFVKMEELMSYINQHPDIFNLTIQFSTLNDYFSVVMSNNSSSFPTLTDVDFFPYIACYPCFSETCGGYIGSVIPCGIQTPDAYWSGYYSSKPVQKLLAREQELLLSALDNLNVVYPYYYEDMMSLVQSRKVQSLLSHHDAITGTSFPPAYDDYNNKLNMAIFEQRIYLGALENYVLCGSNRSWSFFSNDTSMVLDFLKDKDIGVLAIFNPLIEKRSDYVTVNVPMSKCFKVANSTGQSIQFQRIDATLYIPITIDPLEIQTLFLSITACSEEEKSVTQLKYNRVFSNGYVELEFDRNSNHISSFKNIVTGQSVDLSLLFTEVFERKSSILVVPNSVCDGSNVYTFVPDTRSRPLSLVGKNITTVITSSGPLVWEIKQDISTTKCPIHTTIRIFKPIEEDTFFKQFIQIQNSVGPLEELHPNSIIFTVNTSLYTDSRFITYANGLYPMNREYNISKPPQGNFYPLVGRISIKDTQKNLSLILSTKRPMAITSREGSIDLLVHRRIKLLADPRGNDASIMDDPIFLGIVNASDTNEESYNAMSYSQSPLIAYVMAVPSMSDWNSKCISNFHPIKQSLPKGIKLLDMKILEPPSKVNTNYKIGIRLVNIGKTAVQVNLSTLFATYVSGHMTTPDYMIVLQSIMKGIIKLPPYKLMSGIMMLNIQS